MFLFFCDAYLSPFCPYVAEHLSRVSCVGFLFSCSLFYKLLRAAEKKRVRSPPGAGCWDFPPCNDILCPYQETASSEFHIRLDLQERQIGWRSGK